jgi:putative ABC transport system substrate-binding protein
LTTATIPIAFHSTADPLEEGLVMSLARPGGNLTGIGTFFTKLAHFADLRPPV